jgi:predicted GIY-YIG superfamily endonuclease
MPGKYERAVMNPTYLYRLLDGQGRLLYIGISNGPIYRLFQHLEEKPWAPQIAWQNVQRFASREDAEEAERDSIRCERPLYNIQFNNEEHAQNVRQMYADKRHELFLTFEQNRVPKAPSLTIQQARTLARGMCGAMVNFSKSDWIAWCDEPWDSQATGSGTHG